MTKAKSVIWGIILVVLGVIFGLNACGVTDINIFFDGWWTLFIIVPCAVSLITDPDKTDGIVGIGIGLVLLLACQGVFSFTIMRKLFIPFIIVLVGLALIFRGSFSKAAHQMAKKLKNNDPNNSFNSMFSSQNISFANEPFEGAALTAVFGGIDCDLRGCILTHDVAIDATSVFGGIDIWVPDNVSVKISSTPIFGGVSDKRPIKPNGAPVTVYVNANCIFGGVTIK